KERRLKRFDEKALILQKMYFKPENFALAKLVINDKTNHRTMEMDFDDFTRIKNRDYPGTITMNFVSPVNKVNLHVRMVGFSTDTISAFNFNIPGKYEKIVVN
ncbi:MAG: DUF4292 domain-containing protein, partial [Prolixibacteraceae bacterium]|nr:DUF4292 domain-containing protein [Prolixibacteraceae bacterium]